ncbi:MAG: VOC family protein [Myxococcota bacterium]
MSNLPILTPRLVCPSAADAISFYCDVFDARELERYAMPSGHIVHAAVSIRGAILSLADAKEEWGLRSPLELEGTAVLLTLLCDDPDATAERAVEKGAEIVISIEDRYYGHREGRIRDPFGHLWILSKVIAKRTPVEIQRGTDEFGG